MKTSMNKCPAGCIDCLGGITKKDITTLRALLALMEQLREAEKRSAMEMEEAPITKRHADLMVGG